MDLHRLTAVSTILILCIIMVDSSYALADDGYAGGVGENPIPRNSEDIVMDSEVVNIVLHEGFAEVECAYRFINEGSDQTVVMGFPNKTFMEMSGENPAKNGIGIFRAFANDIEIPVRSSTLTFEPDRHEAELYGQQSTWFFHDVPFKKGETKIVVNRYIADHGGTASPITAINKNFNYVLRTGSSWKGVISRADINISYASGVSWNNLFRDPDSYMENGEKPPEDPYRCILIVPKGYEKNASGLSWSFTDFEPNKDSDIMVGLYFNWNKTGPFLRDASASSWLNAGDYQYHAKQAVDDSVDTAWAEGAPGSGIGEYIKVTFNNKNLVDREPDAGNTAKIIPYTKKIAEIRILPGYVKRSDLLQKYGRPKKVTMSFSDGTQKQITLADEPVMQYFTLDKPVIAKWAKLRIDDVYAGKVSKDTYISEIEFGPEKTVLPVKASELLGKLSASNTQNTGVSKAGVSKDSGINLEHKKSAARAGRNISGYLNILLLCVAVLSGAGVGVGVFARRKISGEKGRQDRFNNN
jgi:hypothetical protein